MPFKGPAAAFLNAWLSCSFVVSLRVVATKSTTETVTEGTRKDIPSKRPLSSGMTRARARAAPVVVVRVDGVHQAALDAECIIQDLGGWGQTVCCAGCVRDNGMFGWIVYIFVDTQHDREIFALGGSGDNYFFRAALQVCGGFAGIGEEAGGLDNDVGTKVRPGDLRGIALRDDLDFVPIDDQRVFGGRDLTRKTTVGGDVLQQVSICLRVCDVVNGNDFQFLRVALDDRLQRLSSNTSKTIDAYAGCHHNLLLVRFLI